MELVEIRIGEKLRDFIKKFGVEEDNEGIFLFGTEIKGGGRNDE